MSKLQTYLNARLKGFKPSGNGYAMAVCPFHHDNTPSLSVTLETGHYRCFACSARGSLPLLIVKLTGLSFAAALSKSRELQGGHHA